MNQVFKSVLTFFILAISVSAFAQKSNNSSKGASAVQPMFTLGTSYNSFQGDIMGPESSSLLGNLGYNAGMRLNISKSLDLSLLFSKINFYEKNNEAVFESNIDGVGLHLGYTFNTIFKKSRISPHISFGIKSLSYKTLNKDFSPDWTVRESAIAIPLAAGFRLNVSKRIDLDATFDYTIALGDIDKSVEEASDKFVGASFTIHYDIFTPKKDKVAFDDSYYADVNFIALDGEDEDKDGVVDVDDYCPKTPAGVKVNKLGCPLDDDKDGIPNYIDEQKETPEGAVVDEKGVQLTAEKYQSMYADIAAASRVYANFYNESEIKRENYKTIDEYLIAKANAFNKAYNQGLDFDNKVAPVKYRIKIGEFKDGVPAKVINKYLSFDDLESMPQDNGFVVYTVGSYDHLELAMQRSFELEAKGFKDMTFLIDNNGEISEYVEPKSEPVIDTTIIDTVIDIDEVVKAVVPVINENTTVYKVQIGAYKVVLSEQIFEGVEGVSWYKEDDGLIRYNSGSFADYKDAANNMREMRARGFDDAFIVTYKNGKRIGISVPASKKRTTTTITPKLNKVVKQETVSVQVEQTPNITFTVQVLVGKESLPVEDLNKMSTLGNIEKHLEAGSMYLYFAGVYTDLAAANTRLAEAKNGGYPNAFIFAELDGERISMKHAKDLLK